MIQNHNKKWKRISSEMALDEKWFRVRKDVVKLPNGTILDDYFIWLSGDVSMIVPVTKDNKFVLVKEYKYGANEKVIGFPAGFVDRNEKPEEAAKRELAEETGYSSNDFELLLKAYSSPTKSNGNLYIYLAKNAIENKKKKMDISEDIEVLKLSFKKVYDLVMNGDVQDCNSVAAFFLASKKLGLM